MKRKLSLVLAMVMVIALLAACGNNPNNQPTQPTPDTSNTTPDANNTEPTDPVDVDDDIMGDGSVYTLTIHHHDPVTSATGQFLEEWASRVTAASMGRLQFDILHGGTLGSPRDTYDFVTSGAAHLGWGLVSYFPGVFTNSEAIALPMLPLYDADMSSYVFWNLYENTDFLTAEYEGLHVLLLHANSQSPISTKSFEIKTVEDLAGWNIRVNSGPPTEFVKNLGASPLAVTITELYNAIDNNTVDAVITDWHAIKSFQLFEPIGYYLEANVGVSGYFFVMNQEIYAALPAELQKVLDEQSGAAALEYCGSFWNDVTALVKDDIAADNDIIYTLSDEEQAKLQAIADQTIADWTASHADGDAIYEAILGFIDEYNANN